MVSREHNRVAEDNEETKQWYGIYTSQEFYSLHEKMCQIDAQLEKLVPEAVKPIKGSIYSTTYFLGDFRAYIAPDTDTQDNRLCREITVYLDKAFEALGKNLYVDILFNGIATDHYFEVYSDFSLGRIMDHIEAMKTSLNELNDKKLKYFQTSRRTGILTTTTMTTDAAATEILNDMRRKYKYLLEIYYHEDQLINDLTKSYAEYYNNLLNPLSDSRQLAQANLMRYKAKVQNQERTNKYIKSAESVAALDKLRECVAQIEREIAETSMHIDQNCVQHKQTLIEMFQQALQRMQADRDRFAHGRTTKFKMFFSLITKERTNK